MAATKTKARKPKTGANDKPAPQTIAIDLDRVTELASHGLTQEQIAAGLGISERTLYQRKADSAEFAEAIKRGQAQGIETVANALFANAKGGNVTAQIFFLKARAQWKDKHDEANAPEDQSAVLRELADKLPD